MRVRDVIKLIKMADEINLSWNGLIHPLDPNDSVEMDAYGDYAVESITASGANKMGFSNTFEIGIVTRPVRVNA